MRLPSTLGALILGTLLVGGLLLPAGPPSPVRAAPVDFTAQLSGPAESPANASPGVGAAQVELDTAAHTLHVHATFSGLQGTTSASHIHACTPAPLTGTAGVATQVPTFVGFPLGVTAGTYDMTFDTSLASTYNPSFVTARGSVANAEAALGGCIASGQAYLNIHTSLFPNGEIRGFLLPAPLPTVTPTATRTSLPTATATPSGRAAMDQCKEGGYQNMTNPRTGEPFRNQGECVSFFARDQH